MSSQNKYNASRTHSHDGRSFASKLEKALYEELKKREVLGLIRDIKCQQHVSLTEADIKMIPDFSAIDCETGAMCYYEAKGVETDVWRIKRRLWKSYGPAPLRIFKGSHKKIYEAEVLEPKRKA